MIGWWRRFASEPVLVTRGKVVAGAFVVGCVFACMTVFLDARLNIGQIPVGPFGHIPVLDLTGGDNGGGQGPGGQPGPPPPPWVPVAQPPLARARAA